MILGVGIDIENVDSFRKKNLKRDQNFFKRVFSKNEIRYCKKFSDPSPRFTARFCAKEACVKAATAYVALWISDVEVVTQKNGMPVLKPRSNRKEVKKLFKNFKLHLSLSHTKEMATAFVVIEKRK